MADLPCTEDDRRQSIGGESGWLWVALSLGLCALYPAGSLAGLNPQEISPALGTVWHQGTDVQFRAAGKIDMCSCSARLAFPDLCSLAAYWEELDSCLVPHRLSLCWTLPPVFSCLQKPNSKDVVSIHSLLFDYSFTRSHRYPTVSTDCLPTGPIP